VSTTSSIEWTDKTWNPVRGCSVISPGCVNCYAMKQAHRFSGPGKAYAGLTKMTKAGPQWTGAIRTVDDALRAPLSWRKPARVFVNSMSDLFHEDVPFDFVCSVFGVMAKASRHTFQILTKRPARMREWFAWVDDLGLGPDGKSRDRGMKYFDHDYRWPLPNVWLGVSVEDQKRADERIPLLLQTPAAVRFISAEPLLGALRIENYLRCDVCKSRYGTHDCQNDALVAVGEPGPCPYGPFVDWVIVGGESGPGARPFDVAWARSIVAQCKAAGVASFVKQLGSVALVPSGRRTHFDYRFVKRAEGRRFKEYDGEHWQMNTADRKGGDPLEWPADLRVRQFPQEAR
jgi:protein gp37